MSNDADFFERIFYWNVELFSLASEATIRGRKSARNLSIVVSLAVRWVNENH